jgi:hypothetical protein
MLVDFLQRQVRRYFFQHALLPADFFWLFGYDDYLQNAF